jgi:hypothetical protein
MDEPTPEDLAFLMTVIPPAAGSIDRLEQVPDRLDFLFDYAPASALAIPELRAEAEAARPVIAALAADLAGHEPLLDRERFRAAVARVRERTGQKGRALLHPIRLALTGRSEGLELDLAVPAMDAGAQCTSGSATGRSVLSRIPSAAERAAAFEAAMSLA